MVAYTDVLGSVPGGNDQTFRGLGPGQLLERASEVLELAHNRLARELDYLPIHSRNSTSNHFVVAGMVEMPK